MPAIWKSYLAVMVGGAFGSALRMWLAGALTARYGESFPIGTLVVNILGCFVIGAFAGLTGLEGPITASPLTRQFVVIGVLGGFTTFSSFGLQTFNLLAGGEGLRGGLYIALSVLLCLLAVWLGHMGALACGRAPAG